MPQRRSAFGDLPALDPTSLLCLEIDIELRDAWELLDLAPDVWDDVSLEIRSARSPDVVTLLAVVVDDNGSERE